MSDEPKATAKPTATASDRAEIASGDQTTATASEAPAPAAETVEGRLWERRYLALYEAELGSLYHRRRERFFENADKTAKAVAIIFSAASVVSLIGSDAVPWTSAAITVTSTASLLFGFADRSRRHAALAADFKRLEGDIITAGEYDFTEPDVTKWLAAIRSIEVTEPAALDDLVTDCQNKLALAVGQNDAVHEISWLRRMKMHFA